ncbi:signal recognition particle subunit SRP68-like [Sycon ciliatum]|uniref:signal recognition particle subunit SRP68-like n=1 Tax=Sycon ciliatum TaxID=27933 RepID=UPI0031F66BC7
MATETASSVEACVEDVPAANKAGEPYCVEILLIIKDSQAQHGLRHNDYSRYRAYCARRIHRIRKSLHFQHGHKSRYNPKKITVEKVTDVRYLHLVLMSAERAWAYAMELRPQSNTEPRKHFSLLKKLRRAEQYAVELEELCSACPQADARTKLEAQAYSAWIHGTRQFELKDYKNALSSFRTTRTIYERLSEALVDEEQRRTYQARAQEVEPNIQYCAYQIGQMQGTTDIKKLMELRKQAAMMSGTQEFLAAEIDNALSQVREKQATKLQEVSWHGAMVPVRNEKVRVFLIHVQDSKGEAERAETHEAVMELYDNILSECQQAAHSLQEDLKVENANKRRSETIISQLQQLLAYLSFTRLTKTAERNLLMAQHMSQQFAFGPQLTGRESSAKAAAASAAVASAPPSKAVKPEEVVRVYDLVLQNVSDMLDLGGVDEDEQLTRELSALRLCFRSFRCFFSAEAYAATRRWKEALALYDRTSLLISDAESQLSQCSLTVLKEEAAAAGRLSGIVRGRLCAAQASYILDVEAVTEKMGGLDVADKPLLDRLDSIAADKGLTTGQPNIIAFPPDFEAIACKPLFFDLALNHIDYPDLDDRIEKQAGGLTGFVKGLFWGGK